MLGRFFDFVLDLTLDWDNVEDYTQYVREEPEVLDVPVYAVESPPVVQQARIDRDLDQDDNDDSWYELKVDPMDIPLPIFRGGVTVGEAEDRIKRSASALWDIGREIVVWD